MTNNGTTNRVQELVAASKSHLAAGHLRDADLSLREASALDPQNTDVSDAWHRLSIPKNKSDIVSLSKFCIESEDEKDAQKIIDLAKKDDCSVQDAAETLRLLLPQQVLNNLASKNQVIIAVSSSANGSKALASMLRDRPTETFSNIWRLGDNCVHGLVRTLLNVEAWRNEEDRDEAARRILLLFLAKLLEPEVAFYELAMWSIAQLMTAVASALASLIDNENFAILLSFLNVEQPIVLKSQALLAVAKYLEASPGEGKRMVKDYVISHLGKKSNEDVITAISVAGAIFPIVPDLAASLFLGSRFAEDIEQIVKNSRSTRLRQSALELLSAACIDKGCRERIRKSCTNWLEDMLHSNPGDRDAVLTGLILAKIRHERSSNPATKHRNELAHGDLVVMFKNMAMNSEDLELERSVEGLVFSSIDAEAKELLANDQNFLRRLISMLLEPSNRGTLLFGGLTIFANLTTYPPKMSNEEKRMAQLKAYANQTQADEASNHEDENHVTARCKKVLDAGVAAVIVKVKRKASPVMLNLIATILLSISQERKHCGIMAQQGLFDTVLQLAHLDQEDATGILPNARRQAAHALARMLISVPPELFFARDDRAVQRCIGPMNFLISHLEPQDPHCAFDGLRALTNIASLSEESARLLSDNCFSSIEVYLQASRSAQQQAAVECVCNLSLSNYFLFSHYVFEPEEGEPYNQDFDMDNPAANQKEVQFQRLIWLTSAKARGTRLAAMGALAGAVRIDMGRKMLIRAPDGLEHIMAALTEAQAVEAGEALGLTGEDAYRGDVDMRIRAACVINEICCNTDDADVHRRLVRHGIMKLVAEGAKYMPSDEPTQEQLQGYTEPIVTKLKETFKKNKIKDEQ